MSIQLSEFFFISIFSKGKILMGFAVEQTVLRGYDDETGEDVTLDKTMISFGIGIAMVTVFV